jgi:uncharacterized protein
MSVFLTPDLKPFYGGTYFPPKDYYQRPGFSSLLLKISKIWETDQKSLIESSESITYRLQEHENKKGGSEFDFEESEEILDLAKEMTLDTFDQVNGGFSDRPKFPTPVHLDFLFRMYKLTKEEKILDACLFTLDKMAKGGIYDHLGGGFHRYR